MKYILSQSFGILGVICFIASFQIKNNKKLFLVQILANIMFGIQFVLLSAYTGCVSLVICIVRNLLMMRRNQWKWTNSWVICGLLLTLSLGNTVLNWEGWFSIFSFGAVAGSTIGYWSNNARAIRTSNLFCASPCWIVYDVAVGAWAGVINEIIAMVSILISVYRFGWKELGESGKDFND